VISINKVAKLVFFTKNQNENTKKTAKYELYIQCCLFDILKFLPIHLEIGNNGLFISRIVDWFANLSDF